MLSPKEQKEQGERCARIAASIAGLPAQMVKEAFYAWESTYLGLADLVRRSSIKKQRSKLIWAISHEMSAIGHPWPPVSEESAEEMLNMNTDPEFIADFMIETVTMTRLELDRLISLS